MKSSPSAHAAKEHLIEFEERLVDLKNVVSSMEDKVGDDSTVEYAATKIKVLNDILDSNEIDDVDDSVEGWLTASDVIKRISKKELEQSFN